MGVVENDELAREIAAARGEHARAIVAALRERYRLPAFVDLDAIVTLLIAAMTHSALHAAPGALASRWSRGAMTSGAGVERVLTKSSTHCSAPAINKSPIGDLLA